MEQVSEAHARGVNDSPCYTHPATQFRARQSTMSACDYRSARRKVALTRETNRSGSSGFRT